MAVTVAHYFTPNGTDIGHKGVTPDVKVELDKSEQEKLDHSPALMTSVRDPQYQRAILVLRGSTKAVLKARSNLRTSTAVKVTVWS